MAKDVQEPISVLGETLYEADVSLVTDPFLLILAFLKDLEIGQFWFFDDFLVEGFEDTKVFGELGGIDVDVDLYADAVKVVGLGDASSHCKLKKCQYLGRVTVLAEAFYL